MNRLPLLFLLLALAASAAYAADLPALKRDYEAKYLRFLAVAKEATDPATLESAAKDLEAARAAFLEAGGRIEPGTLDELLGKTAPGPRAPKPPAPPPAVNAGKSAPPARIAGAQAPSAFDRAKKRAAETWLFAKRTVAEGALWLGERVRTFLAGQSGPFAESFDESRIERSAPDASGLPAGFSLGVNLPWLPGGYGWDLGVHGEWGTRFDEAALDRSFARFAALGLPVVRWFLYCDGRANPKFDAKTGRFLPPDPRFLADLDRAVALARKHKVRIVWSFLDFHWFQEKAANYKVYSRIATDAALRRDFIEKAVLPVVERYAEDPAIHAWEVINEPEWVTRGVNYPGAPGIFTPETLKVFVRDIALAMKGASGKPVTVGSAHPKWLHLCAGAGLDLYQAHFYDKGAKVAKAAFSAREFKRKHRIDAPVILGEFASKGSRYTVGQWIRMAEEAGYDGAWVWGYHSEDESTDRAAIDALSK